MNRRGNYIFASTYKTKSKSFQSFIIEKGRRKINHCNQITAPRVNIIQITGKNIFFFFFPLDQHFREVTARDPGGTGKEGLSFPPHVLDRAAPSAQQLWVYKTKLGQV